MSPFDESQEEGDDEISIDFGKIKSFFSNLVSDEEEEQDGKEKSRQKKSVKPKAAKKTRTKKQKRFSSDEEDDDEISIDFKAMGSRLKKTVRRGSNHPFLSYILPIGLILIAAFLSVDFRMTSAHLPITEDWSRSSILNVIQSDVANVVHASYPTLPDANKNNLIQEQFREQTKDGTYTFQTGQYAGATINIEEQAKAGAQGYKDQLKDDDGVTYLLAIDPWTHFRKVRNKIETGEFYDVLKDGEPWNDHMLAPNGRKMQITLHHHLGYLLYKFLNILGDATPLESFFLIPVWFSTLAVIPAFYITRRLGGNLGGFIAAVIIAVHPVFLGRTAGGFSDTDPYGVVFPLFIAWAFLEAFESDNLNRKIVLGAVAGFLVGLYNFSWSGWWYIFDFILAMVGAYMVLEVIKLRVSNGSFDFKAILRHLKPAVILLLVFFVTSGVFVTLFPSIGSNHFPKFFTGPFEFTQKKVVAQTKIWPNVYTTVAELNPASVKNVISQISFGKPFYFWLSALGLVLTMIPLKRKIDAKYAIFLTIWYLGTIYASLSGVRFIILLVPAFSIALGTFAGLTLKYGSSVLSKSLGMNKTVVTVILTVALLLLLVVPIRAAEGVAKSEVPSMSDAWYDSLNKIRLESQPDAIINSWWDFGHWFKAIADRAVTFDGASQNTPQAHWIGRVLLTENEKEAIGILRMLDCGANDAFDTLDSYVGDQVRSTNILYDIVVLDKDGARTRLEQEVTADQADAVLRYSHCDPPENYFITSGDMVGKSGVWGHFGSWSMKRAAMYNRVSGKSLTEGINILQEEFGYSENDAKRLIHEIGSNNANDWISPWPSYSGEGRCTLEDDLLTCQSSNFGFTLNRTSGETVVPTNQGEKSLLSISFVDSENNLRVVKGGDNALVVNGQGYGAVIFGQPNPDQFVTTITQVIPGQHGGDWLPGSMFSRLYYQMGHDLEHFELFDNRRSVTGTRITTWKVNWDGRLKDTLRENTMVWADYLAVLEDGTVIDSTIGSWDNASLRLNVDFEALDTQPLGYSFGTGPFPPIFHEKTRGMKEGERRNFAIEPEEGYTDPNHPLFNQTIIYSVQISKIA